MKRSIQVIGKGKALTSIEAEKRHQLGLSIQTEFHEETTTSKEQWEHSQACTNWVVAEEKIAWEKYMEELSKKEELELSENPLEEMD